MSKFGISRPTAIVAVVTNMELLADHQQAREELERLNRLQPAKERLNSAYSAEIRAAAKRIEELEQEMDRSTILVKLRALKRTKYEELVAQHPPREDNDVDKVYGVNTDTFGDTIIPLSIVEAKRKDTGEPVDFTGDDWESESEELTDAQYTEFVQAVLTINRGATSVPFSQTASAVNRS